MEIWKILLTKTDELSKRRQSISELLLTQVSDVAKQQKRMKEANFKRVSPSSSGTLAPSNKEKWSKETFKDVDIASFRVF